MRVTRNYGIDLLKILACFGVVGLHTIYSKYTVFLYYLCAFAIPVFFVVHGYFLLGRKELSFEYSMLLVGDIKIKTVSEINILLNKMLHEENTYMEEETIKELIICNFRFLITAALLNDYMEEYLIINDFDYFDIIKDSTINIAFDITMRDANKDLLDRIIEDYIALIKKTIMVDDNSDLYILLNSKMAVQLLIPYMGQEHLVKYKKEIEGIRVTNDNSQAIYALSDTIKKRIKKIQDTN